MHFKNGLWQFLKCFSGSELPGIINGQRFCCALVVKVFGYKVAPTGMAGQ